MRSAKNHVVAMVNALTIWIGVMDLCSAQMDRMNWIVNPHYAQIQISNVTMELVYQLIKFAIKNSIAWMAVMNRLNIVKMLRLVEPINSSADMGVV